MLERADLLAEHYQKTYELTYELWKQRNRTFLMLLGVLAVAALVSIQVQDANHLLVDAIANSLGIRDPQRVEELRTSFPVELIYLILLVVVFYLMVNLHHRAVYVLRNYRYLGALESELREALEYDATSIAFTRESTHYWNDRGPLLGLVKWIYILFLGGLLISFLTARLIDSYATGNIWFATVNAAVAVAILAFYLAYARASVAWDTAKAVLADRTLDSVPARRQDAP